MLSTIDKLMKNLNCISLSVDSKVKCNTNSTSNNKDKCNSDTSIDKLIKNLSLLSLQHANIVKCNVNSKMDNLVKHLEYMKL